MELHINRTIGPILSFRVDVTYSRGSTFNYKKSHYSHAEYDHVSVLISIKIYRLNYILHFIIVCTYKIYLNEEKFALASLHYQNPKRGYHAATIQLCQSLQQRAGKPFPSEQHLFIPCIQALIRIDMVVKLRNAIFIPKAV